MKFTAKRALAAGVIALGAVAVPLTISVVGPLTEGGVAASSTPPPPDTVQYVQTTSGKASTYSYVFTPGNGSGSSTQTLTPSGKCGTPTVAAGFLNLGGKLYAANDYSGTSAAAPVGTSRAHTGVCAIGGQQTIDNRTSAYSSKVGGEALTFGVGSIPIGTNRLFSQAQVTLEREGGYGGGDDDDFYTSSSKTPTPVSVRMIESVAGSLVASQTCTITGPSETQIVGDTNLNANCTGTAAGVPFDTLEIQVPTVNAAVSVVGTSTFTLANQVCGGGSVTSTGSVSATLSVPSGSGCESYSSFSSTIVNSGTGQSQQVNFNAHSTSAVPFTLVIPWAPQADCQPSADTAQDPANPSATLPVCAPTQVAIDNVTFNDQNYCAQPGTGAFQLCTQNKVYNYITASDGSQQTQITETWVGDIDFATRH